MGLLLPYLLMGILDNSKYKVHYSFWCQLAMFWFIAYSSEMTDDLAQLLTTMSVEIETELLQLYPNKQSEICQQYNIHATRQMGANAAEYGPLSYCNTEDSEATQHHFAIFSKFYKHKDVEG